MENYLNAEQIQKHVNEIEIGFVKLDSVGPVVQAAYWKRKYAIQRDRNYKLHGELNSCALEVDALENVVVQQTKIIDALTGVKTLV